VAYKTPDSGMLLIGKPFEGEASPGNGNQVGLQAASRATVDAVHARALALGGQCEGKPGIRGDDPNGFYLLLVSDPNIPGVYLTLMRYLDDVRRVHANSITPTEFFSRTILQLQPANPPLTNLNQVAVRDITLEQFLSWQLAKRLQDRLAEHLQRAGTAPVTVGPCVGEFTNGEFAFTLNVLPKEGASLSAEVIDQVFQEATTVIAQVLSAYRFDHFQAIRLTHPATGRNLLLPKTQLDIFR
jgi:hypothetical protein